MAEIVAGRECGGCFECCRFIPIKTERLEKPTNLLCPNCQPGEGCSVYDKRPSECRGWECGWKIARGIPDDWRPDIAGIVFRLEAGSEITATIIDPGKKFRSEQFASLIAVWVQSGVDVYFQAVGPVGYFPSRLLINPHVARAIEAQDLPSVHQELAEMLKAVALDHAWEPDGLVLRNEIA